MPSELVFTATSDIVTSAVLTFDMVIPDTVGHRKSDTADEKENPV